MNIFKKLKAWREVLELKNKISIIALENVDYYVGLAKQSALSQPDREYGEHLMKKIMEFDFHRHNRERSVGFGYKRGSNNL